MSPAWCASDAPQRTLLVAAHGPVPAAAVIADAVRLHDALAGHDTLINQCASHAGFLLAFVAGLLARTTQLLAPAASAAALQRLREQHPHAPVVDEPWLGERLGRDPAQLASGLAWRAPLATRRGPAAPAVDDAFAAAIAFTSGSSGPPVAHRHHWGALVARARASCARLGICADTTVVATVPVQHLYGLEFAVVAALAVGSRLHVQRPFFPADLAAACSACAGDWVLLTTPLHLRSFVRAGLALPAPRGIVTATAPLDPGLAAEAEAQFCAPVREVYGCTEAGSIAIRRPTEDPRWSPHAGLHLMPEGDGTVLEDGFEGRRVMLQDRVAPEADGGFRLIGRSSDMIKVAGKRGSLSELTQALLAIPGVRDGVVFLPDPAREDARPAALMVSATLDEAAVLEALARTLDPALLPRPLRRVARLPRDPLGKLPREALLEALHR